MTGTLDSRESNFLFQYFKQIIIVTKVVHFVLPSTKILLKVHLLLVKEISPSAHEIVLIKLMYNTLITNLCAFNINFKKTSYLRLLINIS